MSGCTGNMYNTAPVDISIQEPEGNETEVCYNTAGQLSGPAHAGDPMNQTSGVSPVRTTLQDSQVILIGMSGSRSSEVTQRQLESDPEPEVTTTQQIQHAQDEEEKELDLVGIDEVEHKTPETTTGGTEMGNK